MKVKLISGKFRSVPYSLMLGNEGEVISLIIDNSPVFSVQQGQYILHLDSASNATTKLLDCGYATNGGLFAAAGMEVALVSKSANVTCHTYFTDELDLTDQGNFFDSLTSRYYQAVTGLNSQS